MVGVEPFVISTSGELSFGVAIFCIASIVEDGGVFSPRIGLKGGLVGLVLVESFLTSLPTGVGVLDRVGLLSGDLFSMSDPNPRGSRSGDFSGDPLRELRGSV